jgi:hypothetical protein
MVPLYRISLCMSRSDTKSFMQGFAVYYKIYFVFWPYVSNHGFEIRFIYIHAYSSKI